MVVVEDGLGHCHDICVGDHVSDVCAAQTLNRPPSNMIQNHPHNAQSTYARRDWCELHSAAHPKVGQREKKTRNQHFSWKVILHFKQWKIMHPHCIMPIYKKAD